MTYFSTLTHVILDDNQKDTCSLLMFSGIFREDLQCSQFSVLLGAVCFCGVRVEKIETHVSDIFSAQQYNYLKKKSH